MKGTSTCHKSGSRLEWKMTNSIDKLKLKNYHISQICVAHLSIFATACKQLNSRHKTESHHSSVWRFSPSSPASILSRSILFSFSINPSSSYCVKNQRCSGSSGLHGFNQSFSGVLVTLRHNPECWCFKRPLLES